MKHLKPILACLAILALVSLSPAQTTGVPGTNDFTINNAGSGGTSPVDPGLTSVTDTLILEVSAPAGQTLFGLAAGTVVPGIFALPPVAAPTSLDLDPSSLVVWLPGASVFPGLPIGNTIGGSGFWTLSVPVTFAGGEQFNLQMAVLDPATGQFTMTQAHAVNVSGFTGIFTSYILTSSSTATHPLTVPVDFYGTTFNSLDISPHGYVKFGNPTADFSPTMAEFFGGFPGPAAPGTPGVAVAWSDYAPTGAPSTWDVFEDPTAGTVKVQFTNQVHWSGGEPAGTFSCTWGVLNPGSVELNLAGFTASTSSAVDIIVGVTNGDITSGPLNDLTNVGGILGAIGSYTSSAPQDSVGEFFPANSSIPFGIVQFVDTGAAPGDGTWTIL